MLQVERARISDVPDIHRLIHHYAEQGQMLHKSYAFLYEHIRQYQVVRKDNRVIAVGALRIFWKDLGEICSLAVEEAYLGRALGAAVVAALEEEAKELGLPKVFALTYREGFFTRCGYHRIPLSSLPQKIWKDCVHCPKRDHCDEIAMLKIF